MTGTNSELGVEPVEGPQETEEQQRVGNATGTEGEESSGEEESSSKSSETSLTELSPQLQLLREHLSRDVRTQVRDVVKGYKKKLDSKEKRLTDKLRKAAESVKKVAVASPEELRKVQSFHSGAQVQDKDLQENSESPNDDCADGAKSAEDARQGTRIQFGAVDFRALERELKLRNYP